MGFPYEPLEIHVPFGFENISVFVFLDRLYSHVSVKKTTVLKVLLETIEISLGVETNNSLLAMLTLLNLHHLNTFQHKKLVKKLLEVLLGDLEMQVAQKTLVYISCSHYLLYLPSRAEQ